MTETAETEFLTQSPTINKITLALSKAQAKMKAAKKNTTNPYFKATYADLSSVWDAIRQPLSEQELAVIQIPVEEAKGTAIVTTLAHSSGEWFRSKLYITPKSKDAQSIGSAITYARRYALSAITGMAPDDDDDDGEKATRTPEVENKKVAPAEMLVSHSDVAIPIQTAQMIQDIEEKLAALNGGDTDAMTAHLKKLTLYDKGAKWVTPEGLPAIGKSKPNWLKEIHKKVGEVYIAEFKQ